MKLEFRDTRRIYNARDFIAPVLSWLGLRAPTADRSMKVSPRERQAEWRWYYSNRRRRLGGCPCGKPAEVIAQRHHDVKGTVPFEWWTCTDHPYASGFSNGVALYDHPRECPEGQTWMRSSGPGRSTVFSCMHQFHR